MDEITIEPTRISPQIIFRPEDGLLSIRGRSSPENAPMFYQQVIEIIQECRLEMMPKLTTIFMMEYFNTSSSRCIIDIFRNLQRMDKDGLEVQINWFYEEDDEDMMETGEDFAELIDIPVNIEPIEEMPELDEDEMAA